MKKETYSVQVEVTMTVVKDFKAESFEDAKAQAENLEAFSYLRTCGGVSVSWDDPVKVTGMFK